MTESSPTTTGTDQAPVPSTAKKSRIGRIVCWAARLTSIPIFALLLVSLIPGLAGFALSPREDQVITMGLCGIAVGFLVAWRWAGIGGLLALLSVGIIVTQEDGPLAADPFSVAFGLQGILFLISWALSPSPAHTEPARRHRPWLKAAVAGLLVLAAAFGASLILRGPGPTPLSKDREIYIGTWDSGAGFKMEITREGRAKISLDKDANVAPCNAPVAPGTSGEFLLEFRDDRLELSDGVLGERKVYHIDRRPFPQARLVRMVLNGSNPYSRTNGMVLLKKTAADPKTEKPDRTARKS